MFVYKAQPAGLLVKLWTRIGLEGSCLAWVQHRMQAPELNYPVPQRHRGALGLHKPYPYLLQLAPAVPPLRLLYRNPRPAFSPCAAAAGYCRLYGAAAAV